jgi:hypothetical protein
MNSIGLCYRFFLLLLLPFLFVLSTVFYTFPTSSKATTNPLLTEISSTAPFTSTATTLKVLHKLRKCHLINVTDTRPFFEREPPQLNLPRKTAYSSREHLLRHLRSLRLVTVACARNTEPNIDNFRNHVEPIVDLFHPSSRILIFESDSSDNTLKRFRQWPRADVYSAGNLRNSLPQRTDRISLCRNQLLEKARELKPDYLLVLDADIFSANISSFLTNFDYHIDDWSVMTANLLVKEYYDIWALRTLSETILNYDVYHRIWAMTHFANYCTDVMTTKLITIHQKAFPIERGLLEVRSAFDGAGLYKMVATNGYDYSTNHVTCEHVPFHVCMREKNQARIFINPKFSNDRRHSFSLLIH